jgi:transcriptional regulator with XRE-family HTH domain
MTSLTVACGPTAKEMRKRAGAWLQELREEAGLTQADMAAALSHEHTSTVSQIERGLGRVPPQRWAQWAELLRQDRPWFGQRLLYWYDPHAHYALFGGDHPQDLEGLPREASNYGRRGGRSVSSAPAGTVPPESPAQANDPCTEERDC